MKTKYTPDGALSPAGVLNPYVAIPPFEKVVTPIVRRCGDFTLESKDKPFTEKTPSKSGRMGGLTR
jgi:hypothetical protein